MFSSARHAHAILFPFNPRFNRALYIPTTFLLHTKPRQIKPFKSSSSSLSSSSRSSTFRASYSSPRMGSLSALDEPLKYPTARRDDSVVDDFHGVSVPDPYRWLEDPDAEEVKEFVQKQVKLTESVLKTCDKREKLHQKITTMFNHPRYVDPFKRGDNYFYFHNTGLQAQNVL